jgi:hypothetical protein
MGCPFCAVEKDELAPVCGKCGRDTAIPEVLIAEVVDLRKKRDTLQAELVQANARLAARRLRKPPAEPV